jgi:hypothetical protein
VQRLEVFQSLWAMELRSKKRRDLSLEACIDKIWNAGFDGVSAHWADAHYVNCLAPIPRAVETPKKGAARFP